MFLDYEFNVGDRVRMIGDSWWPTVKHNHTGTVVRIIDKTHICVMWDHLIGSKKQYVWEADPSCTYENPYSLHVIGIPFSYNKDDEENYLNENNDEMIENKEANNLHEEL